MLRRWLVLSLLVGCMLAPSAASAAPVPAIGAAPCAFRLGFATLHDLIPEIVGGCLENEHLDRASGNTVQATTNGLMVYRPCDNWTAFTNGATTWINGPYGVQSRPNGGLLPFEGGGCTNPPPPSAPTPQ